MGAWVGALNDSAYLLSGLWIASEIWIRVHARRQGGIVRVDRKRDAGSGLALLFAFVVCFGAQIVYNTDPFWGLFPVWLRVLGDLGMVAGIAIRVWAILYLGKYFTGVITVQEGQQVVREGPYRVVRHPSYTGLLLTLFSFPLATGSPFTLLAVALFMPPTFAYRIYAEERMLASELGEPYREYMRGTKRLIPYLL